MHQLTPIRLNALSVEPLLDNAQKLLENSLSPATKKAYAADWKVFLDFCEQYSCQSLPTEHSTLMMFLSQQSEQKKSCQTLRRRLAAIKFIHQLNGFDVNITDKKISLILKGIARQQINRPKQQKKPMGVLLLTKMIEKCSTDTLAGKRDKALLLFGFSGAFRRSELCNLRLDDLEETVDGLRVYIRHSKGDQTAEGQVIALPHGRRLGVISALKDWLESAKIYDGFVFRSISKAEKTIGENLTPLSVSMIVKKYILQAGENPDDYAAHSMRSGFLTEAAENGASIFKMLEVSRHKSTETLMGYIRRADLFKNHAGDGFL